MRYVKRRNPQGKIQRIAVIDGSPGASPKKRKRTPFKVQWVKLPLRWVEVLRRSKSANTKQLALEILFEAFKREHVGGEIVLSSAVTGMRRYAKARAAKELVELGLIETEQEGNEALRVSYISITTKKNRRRREEEKKRRREEENRTLCSTGATPRSTGATPRSTGATRCGDREPMKIDIDARRNCLIASIMPRRTCCARRCAPFFCFLSFVPKKPSVVCTPIRVA
jgi:hypothetical protein